MIRMLLLIWIRNKALTVSQISFHLCNVKTIRSPRQWDIHKRGAKVEGEVCYCLLLRSHIGFVLRYIFCIFLLEWSVFREEGLQAEKQKGKKAFLGNGKDSWYLDFHFESRDASSHVSITWFLGRPYIWHVTPHNTESRHLIGSKKGLSARLSQSIFTFLQCIYFSVC